MNKKQSSKSHKSEADKFVYYIKRQARHKFNSEEKMRIVLARLRGVKEKLRRSKRLSLWSAVSNA